MSARLNHLHSLNPHIPRAELLKRQSARTPSKKMLYLSDDKVHTMFWFAPESAFQVQIPRILITKLSAEVPAFPVEA